MNTKTIKKYKLLKNLPTIKAGAIFKYCEALDKFVYMDKNYQLNYYSEDEINEMDEKWFEEVI